MSPDAERCWYKIASLDVADRCPNPAEWKDGNPETHFMRWCNEHKHVNDRPINEPEGKETP